MLHLSELCVKRFETAVLYFSFLSLGLCTAIPGPTLLDLQSIVKTDISHIAYIYLGRSSGYLIGSFLGGIMLDCTKKKKVLMLLFNVVMSVGVFGTPWCGDVYTLVGVMAISGAAMGALDTGGNVWCLDLWGEDSSPYFQALHFLFGLGAFLSPLIAEPFLAQQESSELSISNISYSDNHKNDSVYFSSNSTLSFFESLPPITFAYSIIGIFSLLVTMLFAVLLCISVEESSRVKVKSSVKNKESSTFVTIIVVLLCDLLLCVYAGIEIGYGQMIATYAVKSDLHLSKATGSLITSVYWGTFTFSRGLSIFLAAKFNPLSLLLTDFALMLLAGVILVLFGNTYVNFLWVSTAILGVALASFYPSTITWIEKHIHVSNKIASSFVVAASLGEMVVPLTISQYVSVYPQILLFIVLISVLICGVLMFILWLVTRKIGKNYVITQLNHKESRENESAGLSIQNDIDENSM